MSRPRLSLCMIVRDEAPNLAACLDSARPWVDEIVVVDTGSTDGTLELAESLGAKVSTFAWGDDFAAARNAALARAQGQWVLSLDADERLAGDSGARLEELLAAGDAAFARSGRLRCYRLRIHNHYDNVPGAPGITISYGRRLFPNHARLRWVRPVHEYVEHLDGPQLLAAVSTDAVVIEHLGYLTAEYARSDKGRRNRRLLQAALAADPNDQLSRFYLGQQLHRNGAYAAAAETLQMAIAQATTQDPAPAYLGQAFVLATNSLLHLGRWQEATELATRGMAQASGPALACELGAAWLARQCPDQAADAFRQAQGWQNQSAGLQGDAAALTWRPWEGLAAAALQQNDFTAALTAAQQAQRLAPHRALPVRQAALAAAQLNRWNDVAKFARLALDLQPDDGELIALLARALEQLGRSQEAHDLLQRAIGRSPEAWDLRAQLAELLISSSDLSAAVDVLAPVLDTPVLSPAQARDPARAAAYAVLARALEGLGQATEAAWARQLAAAADSLAAKATAARLASSPTPAASPEQRASR